MWYRVFGTTETPVASESILGALRGQGWDVTTNFHSDDAGWLQATLSFADTTPIHVERFLSSEEGIRAELNTWAAYLETCDYEPNHATLMEQVIRTKQLFTIRCPLDAANEVMVDGVCTALARCLAQHAEGIYQIDQRGFFGPDGQLLLQEY
jgi:hypothetical protein